jgi:short subunit dehydrogenase-like uncharacterized protein
MKRIILAVMNDVLIYGAYGYTGKLIVEEAVAKGWKPTVAGRNAELVKTLANQYDLPYEVFVHSDQNGWDKALANKKLLLNCAGPFSLTIKEILPACIRNKTHYTDITGEIEVFEYIQSYDKQAKDMGITLLPGTGFDVVPTDCLAKYLSEKMPNATHLELAFESNSGLSRGTAMSVLNRFHQGSAIRTNGIITEQQTASVNKILRFQGKERNVVGIAWGDVFTAFVTTGIPNIQVFTGMPVKMMNAMRRASKWSWLIKSAIMQRIGRYLIREKIVGPSQEKRESLKTYLYGRVWDKKGNEVVAEMATPESYKLTAIMSVICAEKVLNGESEPGFQTPAGAFGPELITQVDGVAITWHQ